MLWSFAPSHTYTLLVTNGYTVSMEAWIVIAAFLLAFILHLLVPEIDAVTWTCFPNGTHTVLQCIKPVQQQHIQTIEEMIAGNDSSVPDLCRHYQQMHSCLNYVESTCRYSHYDDKEHAVHSLEETVGPFCKYYFSEQVEQEVEDPVVAPKTASAQQHMSNIFGVLMTFTLTWDLYS